MTVRDLKKIVDKAVKDGWGHLLCGVMEKDPNGPGYVPMPFEAQVIDWSGWGNTSFCISVIEKKEDKNALHKKGTKK